MLIFISCNSTLKQVTSDDDIIVYKNLDNTLLIVSPEIFFDNDDILSDISIKHMDKSYYKAMIDTLNKYGVKQNAYKNPRPSYAFVAKNTDTIYATNNMDEWWVIRNNKKEFITDKNQKTLVFLLTYSRFFCCANAPKSN